MKNINIFFFCFGQVAKNFIKKLNLENFDIKLSITSRKNTNIGKFDTIDYTSFRLEGDNFDPNINTEIEKANYILVSIPPVNGTDLVIKNFSKMIERSGASWVTYLSATSVYGDHKGQWVDENTIAKPSSLRGLDRLKVEKLWMSFYSKNKIPIQIFRLSGIYSNERNTLTRLKSNDAKIINKKDQFFSRIHVEDIANILFNSLSHFKSGEVFNISDDKPATSEEVILYGIKILGLEKPKTIEIENVKSETLKSFYKDSKKVSNKKMKYFFNYRLKFPSYIEGLSYIRNNFF